MALNACSSLLHSTLQGLCIAHVVSVGETGKAGQVKIWTDSLSTGQLLGNVKASLM